MSKQKYYNQMYEYIEIGAVYCKSDKYRTILLTDKFKLVLGIFYFIISHKCIPIQIRLLSSELS